MWYPLQKSKTQLRINKMDLKAKIYQPSKTATQSGRAKSRQWILEYERQPSGNDFLMGWISSNNTLEQIQLKFDTLDQAINYAQNNNINYEVSEPKKTKIIIKSYADNFLK